MLRLPNSTSPLNSGSITLLQHVTSDLSRQQRVHDLLGIAWPPELQLRRRDLGLGQDPACNLQSDSDSAELFFIFLSRGFGSIATLPVPIRYFRADFKRSHKRWHGISMEEQMRELPNIDDLQVVAEIAEAELAELRKITQAADVLRDQHAVSRKAAPKPKPQRCMSLVSVALMCTGDFVHVQISPGPQVCRAASEFSRASDHPISVVRKCQWFNNSHVLSMMACGPRGPAR